MNIQEIEISKIESSPSQARKDFNKDKILELAQSIQSVGLQNPISLRVYSDGHYEIISGERRFRAFKNLGQTTIPAIVREVTPRETRVMSLIENLQREDLNPMEAAEGFRLAKKEGGYSNAELSRQIGKNRKYVVDHLALLDMPRSLQDSVRMRTLSYTTAIELAKIKDTKMRNRSLKMVAQGKITRQEIRALQKEPVEKPTREEELRHLWGKEPITKPTKKAEPRLILKLGKLKVIWG